MSLRDNLVTSNHGCLVKLVEIAFTVALICSLPSVAAAQAQAQIRPLSVNGVSGYVVNGLDGYPSNAVDGNPGTSWNSGGFAQQFIQIDLGSLKQVSKFRLLVSQYPAGQTVHGIWGRDASGNWIVAYGTLSGYTYDGQWLELATSSSAQVRYIYIQTSQSPSWVGWREIEVYETYVPPAFVTNCTKSPPAGYITVGASWAPAYCPSSAPYWPNQWTHQYVENMPAGTVLQACQLSAPGWVWTGQQDRNMQCGDTGFSTTQTNRFWLRKL